MCALSQPSSAPWPPFRMTSLPTWPREWRLLLEMESIRFYTLGWAIRVLYVLDCIATLSHKSSVSLDTIHMTKERPSLKDVLLCSCSGSLWCNRRGSSRVPTESGGCSLRGGVQVCRDPGVWKGLSGDVPTDRWSFQKRNNRMWVATLFVSALYVYKSTLDTYHA